MIARSKQTQLVMSSMLMAAVVAAAAGTSWAADELGRRASWTPPGVEQLRADIDRWLVASNVDAATADRLRASWADVGETTGERLLERLADTLAEVDEQARELVALCRGPSSTLPPSFELLESQHTPPLVRHNLRLLYGRWLAQHALYDEARQQLAELSPRDVVDPATLLFYQSVVHHRLLEKDDCLGKLTTLLENEATIPRRYAAVARLMEADIKPLKTDSLDEIARLMEDVQRRLQLARAGRRVREQEEEVVAQLDKMIDELQQQQQQQQQQSGSQGGAQSNSPAPDSVPLGGRGPGDVDQKKLEWKSAWGNLPPKEREEALQQISKDLPVHYRDVIEEYFRKLARDTGNE